MVKKNFLIFTAFFALALSSSLPLARHIDLPNHIDTVAANETGNPSSEITSTLSNSLWCNNISASGFSSFDKAVGITLNTGSGETGGQAVSKISGFKLNGKELSYSNIINSDSSKYYICYNNEDLSVSIPEITADAGAYFVTSSGVKVNLPVSFILTFNKLNNSWSIKQEISTHFTTNISENNIDYGPGGTMGLVTLNLADDTYETIVNNYTQSVYSISLNGNYLSKTNLLVNGSKKVYVVYSKSELDVASPTISIPYGASYVTNSGVTVTMNDSIKFIFNKSTSKWEASEWKSSRVPNNLLSRAVFPGAYGNNNAYNTDTSKMTIIAFTDNLHGSGAGEGTNYAKFLNAVSKSLTFDGVSFYDLYAAGNTDFGVSYLNGGPFLRYYIPNTALESAVPEGYSYHTVSFTDCLWLDSYLPAFECYLKDGVWVKLISGNKTISPSHFQNDSGLYNPHVTSDSTGFIIETNTDLLTASNEQKHPQAVTGITLNGDELPLTKYVTWDLARIIFNTPNSMMTSGYNGYSHPTLKIEKGATLKNDAGTTFTFEREFIYYFHDGMWTREKPYGYKIVDNKLIKEFTNNGQFAVSNNDYACPFEYLDASTDPSVPAGATGAVLETSNYNGLAGATFDFSGSNMKAYDIETIIFKWYAKGAVKGTDEFATRKNKDSEWVKYGASTYEYNVWNETSLSADSMTILTDASGKLASIWVGVINTSGNVDAVYFDSVSIKLAGRKTISYSRINPYGWNHVKDSHNGYFATIIDYGTENVDYFARNHNADGTNRASAEYDIGSKLTINGVAIKDIQAQYPYTKVGYDHGFNHLFVVYPEECLTVSETYKYPTLEIADGTEFIDEAVGATKIYLVNGSWTNVEPTDPSKILKEEFTNNGQFDINNNEHGCNFAYVNKAYDSNIPEGSTGAVLRTEENEGFVGATFDFSNLCVEAQYVSSITIRWYAIGAQSGTDEFATRKNSSSEWVGYGASSYQYNQWNEVTLSKDSITSMVDKDGKISSLWIGVKNTSGNVTKVYFDSVSIVISRRTISYSSVNPWNNNLECSIAGYNYVIIDYGAEKVDYFTRNNLPDATNQATAEYEIGSNLTINGIAIKDILKYYPQTCVSYAHGLNHLYVIYPKDCLFTDDTYKVPVLEIKNNTAFCDEAVGYTKLYLVNGTWTDKEPEYASELDTYSTFSDYGYIISPYTYHTITPVVADFGTDGLKFRFNLNFGNPSEVGEEFNRNINLGYIYGYTLFMGYYRIDDTSGKIGLWITDASDPLGQVIKFSEYLFSFDEDYMIELDVGVIKEMISGVENYHLSYDLYVNHENQFSYSVDKKYYGPEVYPVPADKFDNHDTIWMSASVGVTIKDFKEIDTVSASPLEDDAEYKTITDFKMISSPYTFATSTAVASAFGANGFNFRFILNFDYIDDDGRYAKNIALAGVYGNSVIIQSNAVYLQVSGQVLPENIEYISLKGYTDYMIEFEVIVDEKNNLVTYRLSIDHVLVLERTTDSFNNSESLWMGGYSCTVKDFKELHEQEPTFKVLDSYTFNAGDSEMDFIPFVTLFDLKDETVSVSDLIIEYSDGAVTDGKYNPGIHTLYYILPRDGYNRDIIKTTTIFVMGTMDTCHVTFNGLDPVDVAPGSKLSKPVDLIHVVDPDYDYIFDGWYYNGYRWDFENDIVVCDMNLVPNFVRTAKHYIITVELIGIESTNVTYKLVAGVEVTKDIFPAIPNKRCVFYVDGEEVDSLVVSKDTKLTVKYVVDNLIHHDRIEATCTTAGNVEYWTSNSVPGVYYGDSEGVTTLDTIIINPLGHSFGEVSYIWNENHSSCHAHVECTRDGCNHKEDEDATVSNKVALAPSCYHKGKTEYTASFTGENFENQTVVIEDIAQLTHIYTSWTPVNSATHTHTCTLCGNVETVGHTLTWVTTKEATTTETGLKHSHCEDCGYNGLDIVIPVKECDHSEHLTHISAVPCTCHSNGCRDYYKCEDCGRYFEDINCTISIDDINVWKAKGGQGYIAPCEHSYTKDIKYTSSGTTCIATAYCSFEGCDKFVVEIAALVFVEDTAPGCTNNQLGHYEANFTNPVFTKQSGPANSVEIPNSALGHIIILIQGKEATNKEAGYKEAYKCSRCGNYYEDQAATKLIGNETQYKEWITSGAGKISAKGGCGGSITASGILLGIVCLACTGIVLTKKKEEK